MYTYIKRQSPSMVGVGAIYAIGSFGSEDAEILDATSGMRSSVSLTGLRACNLSRISCIRLLISPDSPLIRGGCKAICEDEGEYSEELTTSL